MVVIWLVEFKVEDGQTYITYGDKKLLFSEERYKQEQNYLADLAGELGCEPREVLSTYLRMVGIVYRNGEDVKALLRKYIRNPMLLDLDNFTEYANPKFEQVADEYGKNKRKILREYVLHTISAWCISNREVTCIATALNPDKDPCLYISTLKGISKENVFEAGLVKVLEKHEDKAETKKVPLIFKPASIDQIKLFPYMPPYIVKEQEDFNREWLDLFTQVKRFYKEHIILIKEIYYDIIAGYTLATWLRELFVSVPYISIAGRVATGKSVLGRVLERLAYLGCFMVDVTTSAMAEVDELHHPCFIIDEAQRLVDMKDEKTTEILALLNVRYSRGGKRVKMSDATETRGRELSVKNVFGFTFVSGTKLPTSDALQSRSIKIPTIEGKPKRKMGDIESDLDAAVLRSKLLYFRLKIMVKPLNRDFNELNGLRGRTIEKGFPILYSIPPSYDNVEVIEFFKESDAQEGEEYFLTENAEVLESYCYMIEDYLKTGKTRPSPTVSEIAGHFNGTREEKEQWTSEKMGLMLRSMGFERKKTRGEKHVVFQPYILRAQMDTYNVKLVEYPFLKKALAEKQGKITSYPPSGKPNHPSPTIPQREGGEGREGYRQDKQTVVHPLEQLAEASKKIPDGCDQDNAIYTLMYELECELDEAQDNFNKLLEAGILRINESGVSRI